ncbi:NAD(P)/FAD-dependent oxidoreductase [Candidatus Woesearchaeota archaeon]|nr:NAD(P)/FAD-dependent oxidoreductase [Candidatus Woesearchaeota archaeon]
MSEKIKFAIIGGGVVGCAVAYELSKVYRNDICVLERNLKIPGENQSSRNSGVIHAGIYYNKEDEPLKAKLCIGGNKLLYEFCAKYAVPCKKTGKLVVAINKREEEFLDDLLSNALANNVSGIRKIGGEEVKAFEPNVDAKSALYVPTTGIIDPASLVGKLQFLSESNNTIFLAGNKVVNIKPGEESFELTTQSGNRIETFETEFLINAAGLYSDDVARMVNPDAPYKIVPTRGESAKFYKRNDTFMNGLSVYPVPEGYYNQTGKKAHVSLKIFKALLEKGKVARTVGAHLTPTFDLIEGEQVVGRTVTIGPVKTVGLGKEDYGSNLKSEREYWKRVKKFFPNLKGECIHLHQAGIMAVLEGHKDFVIERDSKFPNCINLIGIDSPGLTSCLAIAKYVKEILE